MEDMKQVNAMLRAYGVDTTKVKAWTLGYFPFTMGGRVWRPMVATLACDEPVHAGKGFFVQVAHGPGGATKVIEATTGAVVGDTLEQVMADIDACDDVDLMKRQIEKAHDQFTDPVDVTEAEWWRRILKAKD